MVIEGCQGKPKQQLLYEICPNCGEEIEMAASDPVGVCEECGTSIVNDNMKCIFWCDHARECVGDEAYEKAMAASDRIEIDPALMNRFSR